MIAFLLVLGAIVLVRLERVFRAEDAISRRRMSGDVVAVDEVGVRRRLSGGREESIRWTDVAEVTILTTDEGPLVDDVFWLLLTEDGKTGCCVPSEAQGAGDLLERLQQLPGFDNEVVVRAMASCTNARFCAWRRV